MCVRACVCVRHVRQARGTRSPEIAADDGMGSHRSSAYIQICTHALSDSVFREISRRRVASCARSCMPHRYAFGLDCEEEEEVQEGEDILEL